MGPPSAPRTAFPWDAARRPAKSMRPANRPGSKLFESSQSLLSAENCITLLLAGLHFLDMDIAEHHETGLIVELQPDGSGLRPARLAGVLRYQGAVELYTDHIVAGFDVERVPVVLHLMAGFGGVEQIHAARRIPIGKAIQNL